MSSVRSVGKYILICLIGIALAYIVAIFQYDAKDLSASVLSVTEKDFFESTQRWAGYKKQNQIFEVFLSEQVRNEWILEVSILYNPGEIERLIDELKSNCSINNIRQDEWNLILTVDWYQDLDFDEWIFEIPYNWDSENITLEYVKWAEMFSVWNLDDITDVKEH